MTLRSCGLPSSGAKAQQRALMTSANAGSTSPFQLCFCRHPPRIMPPFSPRGNMCVASPSLSGARKYIFRSGSLGDSTRRICPYRMVRKRFWRTCCGRSSVERWSSCRPALGMRSKLTRAGNIFLSSTPPNVIAPRLVQLKTAVACGSKAVASWML